MRATEISTLLSQQAEAVASYLLPGGKRHGREWLAGSTAGEEGSSLKVVLEGGKQGMWCDFAGADDDKGDLIGLWQKAKGVDLSTACEQALDWLQVPQERRNDRSHQPAVQKKKAEPKAPDQRWIDLQTVMRPGTYTDFAALAALRGLSIACLEMATRHGQLFFAPVHDSGERHPAWIITDSSRRHAQARKMDGTLWHFGGSHKPAKSKTIWGTDSHWPVGIAEAETQEICLVEGAPDFLAAWHFIWAKGQLDHARPVAMFGASTSIGDDALPLFAGKVVRIFPHNDDKEQGMKAARRWAAQLQNSTVMFYDVGRFGVKDLNELVPVSNATQEAGQ